MSQKTFRTYQTIADILTRAAELGGDARFLLEEVEANTDGDTPDSQEPRELTLVIVQETAAEHEERRLRELAEAGAILGW